MPHGVDQLEEMFAKSKGDATLLKQLENELQYRKVPRAIVLLAEVQAAMYGETAAQQSVGMPAPTPAPTPAHLPQQPGLSERPSIPPVVAPPATTPGHTVTPAVQPPKSPPAKSSNSTPTMPLDEAYKILKASPGATWDSIEQTRRTLVSQSHPSRWEALSSETRFQLLAEAKRINEAYVVLSQVRSDRR